MKRVSASRSSMQDGRLLRDGSPFARHAPRRGAHCTVVGAGIVGLATARALLLRGRARSVSVLESAADVATQQTGRNSGVVHAGLYYKPGSLKAKLCRKGRELALHYCDERGITVNRCGKLVAAVRTSELPSLHAVRERSIANGVHDVQWVHGDDVPGIEPACTASQIVAAVWSPGTAVVDWRAVAIALAADVAALGGEIVMNASLSNAVDDGSEVRLILQCGREMRTTRVVACTGTGSSSSPLGGKPFPKILPVRGSYLTLREPYRQLDSTARTLPRTNVYPVPPLLVDKSPPFLGVHFTPAAAGSVLLGPSAVPVLSALPALAPHAALWRLAARHAAFAAREAVRSSPLGRYSLLDEASRYVPAVRNAVVRAGEKPPGVRAQAIDENGDFVDDFVFEPVLGGKGLNVRNAPSPGATSALAIANVIAQRIEDTIP